MATDPQQGPGNTEETEVPAPTVSEGDVSHVEAPAMVDVPSTGPSDATSAPQTDEKASDAPQQSDVPPEQQTPTAESGAVEVPSARGPAGPPTDPGNTGGAVVASDADPASPTGGANTAGTPASQLDQAPPMEDESGSNIPAPNLVQPLAGDPPGSSMSADSLDPALTNPEEQAKEVHEGTVNDAAVRADGVGQGDVEVATIPETSGGDQEYWPALTVEDAVILGEHELIPERLVGRRAFVVSAPRYLIPVGREDDVWIQVRTRDEVNASLSIPLAAVASVERGGRSPLVRG